jgi:hypothetical protein
MEQYEKLSKEELDKLPAHLKLRLGYLKLAKEKAEKEQKDNKEQQQDDLKDKTPFELLKLGLEKQLKQDEKDGLSD